MGKQSELVRSMSTDRHPSFLLLWMKDRNNQCILTSIYLNVKHDLQGLPVSGNKQELIERLTSTSDGVEDTSLLDDDLDQEYFQL